MPDAAPPRPPRRPQHLALLLIALPLLLCSASATATCAAPLPTTMATHAELLATVAKLTQSGKGILAADESVATFGKRVSGQEGRGRRAPGLESA